MMSRRFFLVLFAATFMAASCPSQSVRAAQSEIISETTAARHGLTRPWFTQVELDRARGRLRNLVLYEGTIYAQTDQAGVHAIDAETGKTLWSKQIGLPLHPTMTPGAYRDFLALINGSRLYVLNRFNGDLLLEIELASSPGAGPALSSRRIYVPMENGQIVAYRLEPTTDATKESGTAQERGTHETSEVSEEVRRRNLHLSRTLDPPLFCQSFGKAMVQPLVTRQTPYEEIVIWPTDRGYLNLARIDQQSVNQLALRYRLQTGAAIVDQPAYLPPDPDVTGDSGLIVTASRDGFVYVFREKDGESLWRFSIGMPIIESPAVIGDRVYVTAQLGGLYCLEIKTGKELWFAPELRQFVAVGKSRVYAADRLGRLVVLDAGSGARLDAIATESMPIKLLNTDTDRIYLADKAGLIQCLHEVELDEPIVHDRLRKLAAMAEDMPAIKQTGIDEADKSAKKEGKEGVAPKDQPKKTDQKKDRREAFEAEKKKPADDPFGAEGN